MAKNINSAYRIKSILDKVKGKADKTPAHEVWSEVFGLNESDQHKRNFAISRCLADLHDEVEVIRGEMLKAGYTSSLYEPSLNKCNATFAVQLIPGHWAQSKQQITPEVLTVLGFCSEILPNEEELIDQSSLDELRKMAVELREALRGSTLPPYTQNIIEKHLSKIEEAISSYKAVGAKALEEVVQSAYGEVILNEGVFKEAKGSEELNKLSSIWQKTKNLLDGVVSANKRIAGVQGMAEKGQSLLEFIQGL
ncbi:MULTISPECIES: hypothetical protein [Shewanella]|uniref:hypothetical protein n=1 Tax=Shewanella TaxID=22 RepID=UPI0013202305|nr:hypothetical protein [Shewanella algae]EKT4488261.1 hypothetical protein [Shewanella algae]MBO2546965.1 hypothetical protein [Shewanella algae]QHD52127.1 hypothetical protein GM320_02515 [Shewanella algae]